MSDSLQPHELQHSRLPCPPSPSPRICSNSCPLSQWCHPTISSSVAPFSSCPVFPIIRVFSSEPVLCHRWPKYWSFSSASVLPVNIQGWFPLGLAGLISLLSKGLSRVFSSTTIQKHQFFCTQPFYGPTLTSVHDYWENHSFDYMDLTQCLSIASLYSLHAFFYFGNSHLFY